MLELKRRKGITKEGKEFDVFYVTVNLGKVTLDVDLKPVDYTSKDLLLLAFSSGEQK